MPSRRDCGRFCRSRCSMLPLQAARVMWWMKVESWREEVRLGRVKGFEGEMLVVNGCTQMVRFAWGIGRRRREGGEGGTGEEGRGEEGRGMSHMAYIHTYIHTHIRRVVSPEQVQRACWHLSGPTDDVPGA